MASPAPTRLTGRAGWKLATTNALNQTTTFAYDLNGNVVRTEDPLLRVFARTYDANDNLPVRSDINSTSMVGLPSCTG
jgi:YD repeat-containing protein